MANQKFKKRILIIDDNTNDIHFIMESLKGDYKILVATIGTDGIKIAHNEPQPDLILLDVMMPGIDGYETCRQLKSDPKTASIDVLFISAYGSTQEKLTGYEVGGSDYIIKPIQNDVLLHKIKLAIKNRELNNEALDMIDSAYKIYTNAMSEMSEFTFQIGYLQALTDINDINTLLEHLVATLNEQNCDFSAQFRCAHDTINISSSNEEVPSIEQEIFAHYKDKEKIVTRHSYAVFNQGCTSLLIKNMPKSEAENNRLTNLISLFLEATIAKLTVIQRDKHLKGVIIESQQQLQIIEEKQVEHKEQSQNIIDNIFEKVENSFHHWGLTEKQEQDIIRIMDRGITQSLHNYELGQQLDKKMSGIFDQILSRI